MQKRATQNAFGKSDARDSARAMFGRPTAMGDGKSTVYPSPIHTPKSKPRPSYSTVLQSATPVMSQPSSAMLFSGKRKRNTELVLIDNSTAQAMKKTDVPSPKQGTKNIQIGKPVELKITRKVAPKIINSLSKSLWVSGFHPDTTNEEIENYIIENTTVTDRTKFRCSKLVKKDQDVSKMSFISFKIDVSPEDFDIISQPEYWSQNVKISEFIKMTPPKPTLNQFMPPSSSESSSPERDAKMKKTNERNEIPNNKELHP